MRKIQIILLLFYWFYVPLKTLKSVLNSQKKKGFEKYGTTLKDCPQNKYDWSLMAVEEIVDFYQYILKMRNKLK